MTLTGQNVEVYQGKDETINATILDSDDSPFNIAGCSFVYVVYKPTTGDIVITKITPSGVMITDESGGIIEIPILPEDTESLLGNYNHECGIVTTDSKKDVVFTGYFKVIKSKTNI